MALKMSLLASIVAGNLLRMLSRQIHARKSFSVTPLHVSGKDNEMADIVSQAFKCKSRGGGGVVIPDAEGTGTFVTMSCQSNHMKWKASMILAVSIGFLGVSSNICGAIANSAGHHSSLSVLLSG